jgi:hypothetical protein
VPSIGKLSLGEKPGTFTPSGVSRKHVAGRLAEDGGYTESGTPAKLELSVNLLAGIDVAALGAIKDEDVTIRLSDGTVWMMSQAFAEGAVAISDGESKLTLVSNASEKIS